MCEKMQRIVDELKLKDAENLLKINKLTVEEIATCLSLPLESVIEIKDRLENDGDK